MSFAKLLTSIVLCATLQKATGSDDYCNIKGCEPNTHALCKYPAGKPDCEVDTIGLSEEQKDTVLRKHNEIRQNVAEGKEAKLVWASNMMQLEWNDEAARIAQRWAERCTMDRLDPCPKLRHADAGQSAISLTRIVTKSNMTAIVSTAIDTWYEERQYLDPKEVKKLTNVTGSRGKVIWHYVAMVNAKTTQIGCGFIEKKIYGDGRRDMILICNYSPPGVVIGAPVYKDGKSCSACPKGYVCGSKYPALCISKTARLQSFTYLVSAFALRAVFNIFN